MTALPGLTPTGLLVERVRNELARRAFRSFLAFRGDRPINASVVIALTHLAGSKNALSDYFSSLTREGSLADERVRAALGDSQNEAFAVGSDSLNFLQSRVRSLRPSVVLELGSGHSTVALAGAMEDLYQEDERIRVFSIDENLEWLETTRSLLRSADLGSRVKLAYCPLNEQAVGRHGSRCYDLSDEFLADFLDGRPDLVLIDGPSGGGNARLATLPRLAPHLASPCTVFLDDAFRTDEVRVISMWRNLTNLELRGVYPLGHGVLEGRLT